MGMRSTPLLAERAPPTLATLAKEHGDHPLARRRPLGGQLRFRECADSSDMKRPTLRRRKYPTAFAHDRGTYVDALVQIGSQSARSAQHA